MATANTALSTDVTGTINESAKTISVAVPLGTTVTALVATFTHNGASIAVASTAQISGTTTIDFSSSVTYKITAADNSSSNYIVTVIFQSGWTQEAYIKAVNNDVSDNFGRHVAIDAETLIIGAHREDSNQTTITNGSTASADNSNTGSGAVYVYKRQ